MKQTTIRWTLYMASLLVVGPLAGALTGSVRGIDGGPAATALVAGGIAWALLATLAALALAGVAGVLAARASGFRAGMTCAGIVAAWAAWHTSSLDDLLRLPQTTGLVWKLAGEGLIEGAAGVTIAAAIWRSTRPAPPEREDESAPARRYLAHVPLAVLVAAAVAAVVAFSGLKGQTIAATTIGVIVGTAAVRLLVQTRLEFLPMVAAAVLALAAPVVGATYHGDALAKAVFDGSVLGFVRPLPLDWVAGGLLGVPVGLSWGASLASRHASARRD